MNVEHYWEEMLRYYSNIVGKYGSPVQRALQKLVGLWISGRSVRPTVRCGVNMQSKAIDIYDRMSRYEGEEGVAIVYGSMYGNTEQMAEAIAASLADERGEEYRDAQCEQKPCFLCLERCVQI